MRLFILALILLSGTISPIFPLHDASARHKSFQNLPTRASDAATGSELEAILRSLPLVERENRIFAEITSGNIPDFLRQLTPVTTTRVVNGTEYTITYHAAPDYLAVGSDEDYFLMPMTPLLAQRLANALGFTMPTRRMVDQIWQAAPLKLNPQPIPPSDQMNTIPVMFTHNTMVREQRDTHIQQHPPGTLVAGHKKDVIISNRIYTTANSVVIYGWHYTNGNPIQPVFAGHGETYADYSHGIRAVADSVWLNGETVHIRQIVQHPDLHVLLSDEGGIPEPYYHVETTSSNPVENDELPEAILLEQNFPNPFNNQTRFRYHLPQSAYVQVSIYTIAGQQIEMLENSFRVAGTYELGWDATGLASGVYISSLAVEGERVSRAMLLIK